MEPPGSVSSAAIAEAFQRGACCKWMGGDSCYLGPVNELMQGRRLLLSQTREDFPAHQVMPSPCSRIGMLSSTMAPWWGWLPALTCPGTCSGSSLAFKWGTLHLHSVGCKTGVGYSHSAHAGVRFFAIAWQWLQMPKGTSHQ